MLTFILLATFLFFTWALSAAAALFAFGLALSARTRRTSRLCALASIVGSIPITLFNASLFLKLVARGDAPELCLFVAVTLTPLMVAVAVFCFVQHSLKNNKQVIPAD